MPVIDFIRKQFQEGMLSYRKTKEICHYFGASSRAERESVVQALCELEQGGEIVRDERGRFVLPEQIGLLRGTLQASERGFAFLLRAEGDLFIPARFRNGALHGDEVFARRIKGESEDEAEVYSVIHRGIGRFIGVYERGSGGGIVRPDDGRLCEEVRIIGGMRAVPGEKVAVRFTAYPAGRVPEGEIERIIGQDGELKTEEDAIICERELPEEFAKKVLAEAARVAAKPILPDGRHDFREDLIITIDGEDSRDFDDAISVQRKDGKYYLGVHIADVTHYAARGGALDKEAFRRGTSVYFPDRVLPMLPPQLSDDVCSLKEGEARYTLSCLLTLNDQGAICERKIVSGIICSRNRMTYEKVSAIFAGDSALCERYAHLLPMLRDAKALAEILIRRRAEKGGQDLAIPEAQIDYCNGDVQVRARERTAAHRMIEAFMILANEAVASYLQEKGAPCLYRIHEKPSEERASAFLAYLRGVGVRVDFQPEKVRPSDYCAILQQLDFGSKGEVIRNVMLRSMAKARYSADNLGHFGIASSCYCHFTSPIRRYPDLLVHRLLKAVLEGQETEKSFSNFVRIAAEECSKTERRAEEAERDVDSLYKVWYMRQHIGDKFDGAISGVTSFGLFVELPNTVEGLIRIEDLPYDDYCFDEERFILRGANHRFLLGDIVSIVVVGCDIGTRRCRFMLA